MLGKYIKKQQQISGEVAFSVISSNDPCPVSTSPFSDHCYSPPCKLHSLPTILAHTKYWSSLHLCATTPIKSALYIITLHSIYPQASLVFSDYSGNLPKEFLLTLANDTFIYLLFWCFIQFCYLTYPSDTFLFNCSSLVNGNFLYSAMHTARIHLAK